MREVFVVRGRAKSDQVSELFFRIKLNQLSSCHLKNETKVLPQLYNEFDEFN